MHSINPAAITIAEDVSGMPGMCYPIEDGGIGFDYRLGMAIPDFWIKLLEDVPDEDWNLDEMWSIMTSRLPGVKTVAYAESHDQALVGDKTIAFRLMDKEMYFAMNRASENLVVERGMALHKMIRLMTIATGGDAYLCFMGNEFGHPEWIDFPREGNGWSHKYARRQWNLVDNKELCFHYLGDFDRSMLKIIKSEKDIQKTNVTEIWHNDGDQVFAFQRGELLFFFNFSPFRSYTDYGFMVKAGTYQYLLNTDDVKFGGKGFNDDSLKHLTIYDRELAKDGKGWLKLYLPARSACVLKLAKD